MRSCNCKCSRMYVNVVFSIVVLPYPLSVIMTPGYPNCTLPRKHYPPVRRRPLRDVRLMTSIRDLFVNVRSVGRDSSVGIATRYGPGIESRWGGGEILRPVQTGPGAHRASFAMGTSSFLGVKRPGRGVDHPPPSRAEVKERVEVYLYSPSGPSWSVMGSTLM